MPPIWMLPLCSSSLRVKNQFVPGLGVALSELERALERVGGTYRPRAYLRREP